MSSSRKLTFTPKGDLEIVMTRAFDAPRAKVFEAWTSVDVLKRWLNSPEFKLIECVHELKPGGRYRYLTENASGFRMGMGGVNREVVPNERVLRTEIHDGFPVELMVNATFTESGGRTTMVITLTYPSAETRTQMTAGGHMEQGIGESLDRMERALAGG